LQCSVADGRETKVKGLSIGAPNAPSRETLYFAGCRSRAVPFRG
jgi:hypothetical protein